MWPARASRWSWPPAPPGAAWSRWAGFLVFGYMHTYLTHVVDRYRPRRVAIACAAGVAGTVWPSFLVMQHGTTAVVGVRSTTSQYPHPYGHGHTTDTGREDWVPPNGGNEPCSPK